MNYDALLRQIRNNALRHLVASIFSSRLIEADLSPKNSFSRDTQTKNTEAINNDSFSKEFLGEITPPTIGANPIEFSEEIEKWIFELDRDPEPLTAFLKNAPHRLGLYHERLWQYFFEHAPGFQLLGHNIPVRNTQRTVGEFDFFVLNEKFNANLHIEVACKYYLQVVTPENNEVWLGPNQKDRLDVKASKLYQHQIRLSEHDDAREVMQTLNLSASEIQKFVSVCGTLFYSSEYPHCQPAALPVGTIAPDHHRAKWYLLSHFIAQNRDQKQKTYWHILEKRDWLAPIQQATDKHVIANEALTAQLNMHFASGTMPLMIVQLEKRELESGFSYQESQRVFICDDQWYERAQKTVHQIVKK